MRLGVYTDLVYRRDEGGISTDLSFIQFATALTKWVDEVVLFGRLDPEPGRSPYDVPTDRVRLVPLPHYPSVAALPSMLRALRRARSTFAAELERLDAVWLFGPHPLALEFARIARKRGTPVFFGIRQELPSYIGNRLPSRWWLWAVPAAHTLERAFRRMARQVPTVVVGERLGELYGRRGGPVLVTGVSLIGAGDIVSREEAEKAWDGPLTVLSVGRLESEKNPLLLPEILALLRRQHDRWRLSVVGIGPMAEDVRRRAEELGVADALDLRGYVTYGQELLAAYRSAHVFLHVSLTEGLPQVLYEAQAAGLPIVATDVGGVRAAMSGGEAGLLVPPRDADAAAAALLRLAGDPELRSRFIDAGLAVAARETLDAQTRRIAAFFRAELGGGSAVLAEPLLQHDQPPDVR
jgi:glycosyltransferase involved in cell wall biosynthesis